MSMPPLGAFGHRCVKMVLSITDHFGVLGRENGSPYFLGQRQYHDYTGNMLVSDDQQSYAEG